MDYELIFWIVFPIATIVTIGLLMARAKKDVYVEWIAEWGDK